MMTDDLDKAHWTAFFTDLAKTHHGFEARLEIIGRAFGAQEAAAWLPFAGMSYYYSETSLQLVEPCKPPLAMGTIGDIIAVLPVSHHR
jgi:Family of unknown function (DUF5335)